MESARAEAAGSPWPGEHSLLDPAGVHAEMVQWLWWPMLAVAVVATLVVVAVLAIGMRLRRRAGSDSDRARWRLVLLGGVVLPGASIVALLVGSMLVDARIQRVQPDRSAMTVDVTAHMWWWGVEHELDDGRTVADANEIHIPVGERVRVRLHAADVIHSFWVPNLGVKEDAVPGAVNELWLHATRAGVYRGVCAELCGEQHAHMAFEVVAQPRQEFEAWADTRAAAGEEARDETGESGEAPEQASTGQQVFMRSCASCHAVAGTPAAGVIGPDLTHIGSRLTIAAGTLPNTREHLGDWISDPQSIKPGSFMPAQQLSPQELQALLDYLETLE